MSEFVVDDSELHHVTHITNILGWNNFLVGQILCPMLEHQCHYLSGRQTSLTAESWVASLIERLLLTTHRQWQNEHGKIYEDVRHLLTIDLGDLLEQDCSLLAIDIDIDFHTFGLGPTENCLIRTSSMYMNTALIVAVALFQWKRKRKIMSTHSGNLLVWLSQTVNQLKILNLAFAMSHVAPAPAVPATRHPPSPSEISLARNTQFTLSASTTMM